MMRNEKGFTLIELLIVIAIIGILTAIAIPQFNQYKERAYNSDAKSNLHNAFLACKAYWADEGSRNDCSNTLISGNASYGFQQSADVSIVAGGFETAFKATAQHLSSPTTYTMDQGGSIS